MNERERVGVLSVRDLTITATRDGVDRDVVRNVNLTVESGQIFGIVGESGSGKTLLTKAATGLLPHTARVSGGSIEILGQHVAAASAEQWRSIHANDIGVIFQNASTALNPRMTIFSQVREALAKAPGRTRLDDARQVRALLDSVEIDRATQRLRQYPHELSGGIAQRVVIAMALARNPKLVIADEATTALDAVVQRQILDLIGAIRAERELAVILISHDLDVVRDHCDDIAVMQAGQIVETGRTEELLSSPSQRYTRELLAASPSALLAAAQSERSTEDVSHTVPIISVEDVTKNFGATGWISALRRRQATAAAVKSVDLQVHPGEIVGLVGASGSGKTTTARMFVDLVQPDSGTVRFNGQDARSLSRREKAQRRREVQYVFQDSYGAFNPRYSVAESILEPLIGTGQELHDHQWSGIDELLTTVGLDPQFAERYPRQLSGGERQRVGIARALVTRPRLIVADEPVSALDVTVQKKILDLIHDLNETHKTSFLVISHDLGVISYLCSRVAVMNAGEIVERGKMREVLGNPTHPYTRQLVAAVGSATSQLPALVGPGGAEIRETTEKVAS